MARTKLAQQVLATDTRTKRKPGGCGSELTKGPPCVAHCVSHSPSPHSDQALALSSLVLEDCFCFAFGFACILWGHRSNFQTSGWDSSPFRTVKGTTPVCRICSLPVSGYLRGSPMWQQVEATLAICSRGNRCFAHVRLQPFGSKSMWTFFRGPQKRVFDKGEVWCSPCLHFFNLVWFLAFCEPVFGHKKKRS